MSESIQAITTPHYQTDSVKSLAPMASGLVIVGAGMAGSRFAIQLATAWQSAEPPLDITLISKEPEVGYNRIMLSPVLSGETAFDETYLYDESDYSRLGIRVLSGVSVDDIDTSRQHITLNNGQLLSYTKLVIATGSTARILPLPNHDAKGVHVFRDLADVTVLSEYAKQGKSGLVIGGGVLGLEAACALAAKGANMTVVHVDRYVLNRQLDETAAQLLQLELASRHVNLELEAMSATIKVNESHEVIGLGLTDGRTLAADFIVMAVGIIPNTELVKNTDIKVNRAIVVDEYMQTSCPNVYAIGECVEINEELFGMVSSVNQHIDSLISVMTHPGDKSLWLPFASVPLSLKLKVSGVAVFSAGVIAFSEADREDIEELVYQQIDSSHYHRLFIKDNILIGSVLYGETTDGSFYSRLINDQTDISVVKDSLIYGRDYCEALLENLDDCADDRANDRSIDTQDTDTQTADTQTADTQTADAQTADS